ncbi:MAG: hypothetical protein KTU85_09275 [Acidimicrobiia bacterium]|nr:hypothetical protein [Acidimicrobiia bacterium]MCY4457339.1 hypothetical protein [Acidimicrobiaceae bacterium]
MTKARPFAAVLFPLLLFVSACADNAANNSTNTTAPPTTTTTAAAAASGHGADHQHGSTTREAVQPYPSVSVRILEDPSGGWLLNTVPTNYRLAPEKVSTSHVDGEGHMHLYIDGVKVLRLFGEWHQMPPLTAGTHEIRVELSTNDHATLTRDGTIVDHTVTLDVSPEQATIGAADTAEPPADTAEPPADTAGHNMDDSAMTQDGATASATPDHTIALDIVDGAPVGGHQRVTVSLNSTVAILASSNNAEEIHIHGYDILHSISANEQLQFSFTANIPGVFEIELEGSGRLLAQLTVS